MKISSKQVKEFTNELALPVHPVHRFYVVNTIKSFYPIKMILNRLKNQKGQVALFVALIFQVLFVFFAMLINVGLLVHHKINLQNSVDLAAYYGASKQAENLNAIAHINYQIRQSWKLMTFRYRQLGSYGDDKYAGGPAQQNTDNSDTKGPLNPAFCINYPRVNGMKDNESYCHKSGQDDPAGWEIPHPASQTNGATDAMDAWVSGLFGFNAVMGDAIDKIQNNLTKNCYRSSALSLYEIINFILAYKIDISDRKKLLLALANSMSTDQNDFDDLDGGKVSDGVRSTLTKNLTYQNNEGLQNLRLINSFGSSECGANGGPVSIPKWLSEIIISPSFRAYLGMCSSNGSNPDRYGAYLINTPPPLNPVVTAVANYSEKTPDLQQLHNFIINNLDLIREPLASSQSPGDILSRSSRGFEKNPWCMGYVGVHAETKPQIPFSPFGTVTLKATAYAKPFGGTIGPWNMSMWNSGSPYSNGGSEIDPVAPPRILPGSSLADPLDPRLSADYSRYVGDSIGTKSNMNMFQFAKALNGFSPTVVAEKINLDWWTHITDPNDGNGDMLAWGGLGDATALHMRETEIAAMAPDNFDSAYYSVEPDYYRNYLLRLEPRKAKLGFKIMRGDLGQRLNDSGGWKTFSIKDEIGMLNTAAHTGASDSHLPWLITHFEQLLTSFKAIAPDQQNTLPTDSASNFGKCPSDRSNLKIKDSDPREKATTGNCVGGGRVGYSVKLVDGEFLNAQDLKMGGGSSTGPLKNAPPQDWMTSAPDIKAANK